MRDNRSSYCWDCDKPYIGRIDAEKLRTVLHEMDDFGRTKNLESRAKIWRLSHLHLKSRPIHETMRGEWGDLAQMRKEGDVAVFDDVPLNSCAALFGDIFSKLHSDRFTIQSNLFEAPKGSEVLVHFDPQPIFSLQLRGRKRWRVRPADGLLRRPKVGTLNQSTYQQLKACFDHWPIVHPTLGEDNSVGEISPGDFVYVPPGYWHSTQVTEDSQSVSATVVFL